MRLGFFDNGIGFRGTTRAIIEYSKFFLDSNEIFIFYLKDSPWNNLSIVPLITEIGLNLIDISERTQIKDYNLDALYHINGCSESELLWLFGLKIPFIHHQCGFNPTFRKNISSFPIPFISAYVSHWQNHFFSNSSSFVLPHVIKQPSHSEPTQIEARKTLNIPESAIVISRHGGPDTWNLPWVSKTIVEIASIRNDIYFLFMNTPCFSNLPNIIFLPASTSSAEISIFLSASDAMLHARWEGETFGLGCAEFLIRKKPLITWAGSRERNHIYLADSSCILYNRPEDLYSLLLSISKEYINTISSQIPHHILKNYSSENIKPLMVDYLSHLLF